MIQEKRRRSLCKFEGEGKKGREGNEGKSCNLEEDRICETRERRGDTLNLQKACLFLSPSVSKRSRLRLRKLRRIFSSLFVSRSLALVDKPLFSSRKRQIPTTNVLRELLKAGSLTEA